MERKHRWLIAGALGASVALASLLEPPQPLVDWLPERLWQVAGLSLAIFLALVALMTIFDVVPLRLTLFGSEVRLDDDVSVLAHQVATLQKETIETAGMTRQTAARVRYLSESLVALERRVAALERGDGSDRGR